jgi:hypothetical protein
MALSEERTLMKPSDPEITARKWQTDYVGPSAYRLTVEWLISNPAESGVYVLLTTPVITVTGDPLILDHTNALNDIINPNIPPGFRFAEIAAGGERAETLAYGIGLAGGDLTNVVGRFAFSHARPGPDWEAQRNWNQVKGWQHLIESAQFTVIGE